MRHFRYFILMSLTFVFHKGMGSNGSSDSSLIFGPEAFFKVVKAYHPLAKQAGLQSKMGEASVLKARGGFDPVLQSEISEKYFEGQTYYSLFRTNVSIPTWYGVEIKSAYEQNGGTYLNPENKVSGPALLSAGVSLSLLRGMVTDQRRTSLQQAKIYLSSTDFEQKAMLNDLFIEAGKVYWDWFFAYNQLVTYRESVQVAAERLEGVKQAARLGDRPYVDTLEAGIQLQERRLSAQQSELNFQNKTILLSAYLWTADEKSYELTEGQRPPSWQDASSETETFLRLKENMDSLMLVHPDIRISMYKLDQLSLERKLKAEQLKPSLKLNYQPFLSDNSSVLAPQLSPNNYKWGIGFAMPILLRKERGDLKLMELKIKSSELSLENKTTMLYNKGRTVLNTFENTLEQVRTYTGTVNSYMSLLDAEKQIFRGGESSLFMINAREISYLNAQIKLIDLIAKNQMAFLQAQYTLGVLNDSY